MSPKCILIVDDDRLLVDALAIRCRKLGLDVRTAFNTSDAVMAINASQPDLVCLDVNMPGPSGLDAARILSAMPGWHSIPVIIMTGNKDPDTVRRCHDMCAYYVLKCNDLWPRMEPLIRELLEIDEDESESANDCYSAVTVKNKETAPLVGIVAAKTVEPTSGRGETVGPLAPSAATIPFRHNQAPVVLVVEDNLSVVNTVRLFLSNTKLKVLHSEDFDGTIRLAEQADVILCDINLANVRGTFIAQELRSQGCQTPIVMMSADGGEQSTLETSNAGIRNFLVKPFSKSKLLETLGCEIEIDSLQDA